MASIQPLRPTRMAVEAREAPRPCADQIRLNAALDGAIGGRLRDRAPAFAATLARGSSDQAAFARLAPETHAGGACPDEREH